MADYERWSTELMGWFLAGAILSPGFGIKGKHWRRTPVRRYELQGKVANQ
jgi:hypothetical protein